MSVDTRERKIVHVLYDGILCQKKKTPELYCLRFLQLYLPWRNEDELCHIDGSYSSKFEEVKDLLHDTIKEFEPYEQITSEDLENAYDSSDDDIHENSDADTDNKFSIFDPDILEFDTEATTTTDIGATTSSSTVKDLSMPNDDFYAMCKDLNAGQRGLFNYLCRFIQTLLHSESNGIEPPTPFYIFLSNIVIACFEYATIMLKFPGQNLNQPSCTTT